MRSELKKMDHKNAIFSVFWKVVTPCFKSEISLQK